MQSTSKGRLFTFYMWTARPTSISSLRAILKRMTDEDLLTIIKKTDSKVPLTIAWAEYGRRHANVDLEFEMKDIDVLTVRATNLIIAQGTAIA